MTEISPRGSQLDRIDGKLDQILDRLTRMEERQDTHAGKLLAIETRIDEHALRLRDVEISHAVAAASQTQVTTNLNGRWAAIGAVALVILATIGGYVGRIIAP